jgi:TetR/AcrR family transcriptional regulator, mexJK operon transcriptional repressor
MDVLGDTADSLAPARRRPGRPSLSNEQLLDKALDLFLEKGFERTSIEAICQAAGMAKRTVYARYGDKTSLFKAALQRAIEDWIVPVEQLRAAESDDLETSLLSIGHILVTNIMSRAGLRLLRLTNAESGRMPEIGAYNVQQGTKPTIDYLADLFARRLGQGLAPLRADEAAEGFLHLVTGPAIDAAWGVRRDEAALERHIRSSVRLFLYGLLGSQPTAVDPASPAVLAQLDKAQAALDAVRASLVLASGAKAP